jgi:hypothetical protein
MVPVLQRNNEEARREFLEISAASAFGYLSLSGRAESWVFRRRPASKINSLSSDWI